MRKNIKKQLLALILVLTMVVSSACSSSEPDNGNEGTPTVTENVTLTATPEVTEEPTKVIEEATPVPPEVTGELTKAIEEATPVPTEAENNLESDDTKDDPNADKKSDKNDNEEVTQVVTVPAEDPKVTIEVTPTEEPAITDIEPTDLPATGRAEPTEAPDSNLAETKYTDISAVDPEAVETARKFVEGYCYGDLDLIYSTMAYDESIKADLDEEIGDWRGFADVIEGNVGIKNLEISNENFEKILTVDVLGGKKFEKEEILPYINHNTVFVEDETTWDNYQIVSIGFSGLMARSMNMYLGGGLNIFVCEKNGEFRVMYAEDIDEYEEEEEDINEAELKKLFVDRSYKFTGNETAQEVLEVYLSGLVDFDLIRTLSATAVDDDKIVEVISTNYEYYEYYEIMRLLGFAQKYIFIEEITEITDADPEDMQDFVDSYALVDDKSTITDWVGFGVKVKFFDGQNEDYTNEEFVVAKVNGVYRVLDDMLFEYYGGVVRYEDYVEK